MRQLQICWEIHFQKYFKRTLIHKASRPGTVATFILHPSAVPLH